MLVGTMSLFWFPLWEYTLSELARRDGRTVKDNTNVTALESDGTGVCNNENSADI